MLPKELIEILACPKCKESLEEREMFLICNKCNLAFPILEDVPDLLTEDAWPLEKAKLNNFKHDLKL
ncbi:MAG: Trm112 family protein [Candidatus Aenigmatarchaeota archaeon]